MSEPVVRIVVRCASNSTMYAPRIKRDAPLRGHQVELVLYKRRFWCRSCHKARKLGNLSHEMYFKLTPPGTPESLELFGVDVWTNFEGMQQYYSDPDFNRAFEGFYTSEPTALFLSAPGWRMG
jgi:hypothetical protein